VKLFTEWELLEAWKYAEEGGQALHLFDGRPWKSQAPMVFRRYNQWAHLMDTDLKRLIATAKKLGVRKVVVGRKGGRFQHVDLCGEPMLKAIRMCDKRKIKRKVKK